MQRGLTQSLAHWQRDGRLLSEVDPIGRTLSYQYTVDDRITKKDYSDTATPDVTYAYDAFFPRAASRQDGAGTTTFTYHPYAASTFGAGQVALIDGPFANDTQKHTYDELGRLKKLEIVDDATHATASYSEEYTFDARARVTGVQNNLGLSTYAFAGQSSRPSTVSYPKGMQVLYDYYGITGDFLLKQIKNLSAGPTPSVISQFDYTYGQDRSIDTWTVRAGERADDMVVRVRRVAPAHIRQATGWEHAARVAVLRLRQRRQPRPGGHGHVGAEELRRE
ncbi:MAG: repeat protein [Labilithrix sp.]|nr:repeat protein [Labilithrix sp.]